MASDILDWMIFLCLSVVCVCVLFVRERESVRGV